MSGNTNFLKIFLEK
jgi:hypothetical protein